MKAQLFKYGIVLIIGVCLTILFLSKCSKIEQLIVLKSNNIEKNELKKDSVRWLIKYKDSVRVKVINKYRSLKPRLDSIPCPEALGEVIVLTDSIIVVDSALISSLKAEIKIDSLLFVDFRSLHKTDSIKIVSLGKQVKRQRFWKKFFMGTTLIFAGIAAVK